MPLIRVNTPNIAAQASVTPLVGNQYEFLPFPARVEFAVVANASTLDVAIFSGSDVLQQSGPPTEKTTPTAIYPDDFLLDDVAAAGERLGVTIRETGNVATTDAQTAVKITPLG